MSTFTTETGIAIKVELTHSKEKGYRLETRRVVGWVTTQAEDKAYTTPVISSDIEGGTGVTAVVRLYTTSQHAALRAELAQVNRTCLKDADSLAAAQAIMAPALMEYVQ
jgi:hypothetical protein